MIGTLAAGIGAWKLKNPRRHERSARGAERFLRRLAADSFRRQTLEDG
jgi:hypothetical protein